MRRMWKGGEEVTVRGEELLGMWEEKLRVEEGKLTRRSGGDGGWVVGSGLLGRNLQWLGERNFGSSWQSAWEGGESRRMHQ